MTQRRAWQGGDRPDCPGPAAGGMGSVGREILLFVLLPLSTCMLQLTGKLCRLTLRLAGQRPDAWKAGAAALPSAPMTLEPMR
ncbi:MAG: hypothetical protein ACRYHQ_25140 [Janthinobacterium lividum]